MGFVLASVIKDLRRHRRNPWEFAIWLGIPLLVGGLMILVFGGSGGPEPQAHVLVADLDQSFVSGLLIGALSQDAMGDFVRAEEVTLADGEARMEQGQATALLVVPAGFSGAILREEAVTLRMVTNPTEQILPQIVEEILSVFVDAHFYLHRLLGEDLKTLAVGPPAGRNTFDDAIVAEFSTEVNQTMERLGRYTNPLLIQLADEPVDEPAEESKAPRASLGLLFLPSILFMALLFMAQGLGNEFWEEDRLNTLRRTLVSPRGVPAFLVGKLVTAFIMIAAICFVALVAGYGYLSLNLKTLPLALLWSTLSGVILVAGMTTLQLFAKSQRAANIIAMALIFPLMMLGGSFFPFEAMSGWMLALGRMTPNGWALSHLKDVLLERAGFVSLLPAFASLLIVLVLLSLVNAWRLRARFARG